MGNIHSPRHKDYGYKKSIPKPKAGKIQPPQLRKAITHPARISGKIPTPPATKIMATKTASRSRSQGNYITPNTAEGKKILNYLRNRCEKALDYCQENGLTSVEHFADAIEELTEADGKPGISVEVKHNGLVLSLSDRPEYGSTTGKYMMEHLGESDDNRFTKKGMRGYLVCLGLKTGLKKEV